MKQCRKEEGVSSFSARGGPAFGGKLQVSGHRSVLLHETIQFLNPKRGEFIIDATIDGGGHASEILKKVTPRGKLLGVDWDEETLNRCRVRFGRNGNIVLAKGNYADLPKILRRRKLRKADGLLLDLGFSSEQLEQSGRGFSFDPQFGDEPLLMTYDRSRKPAREILRKLSERELAVIIRNFGNERFAKRIARAIVTRERVNHIETSGELSEVIKRAVPKSYEGGRIHPATRTFQALRIYANDEMENLRKVLSALPKILAPGGRVVVLSFHSLEDRLAKHTFRHMEKENILKILTKKPIQPTVRERVDNPRSRSAKLRAAILMKHET